MFGEPVPPRAEPGVVAGASLRSSRVVSSRVVMSKYIEYRRVCRQCGEYTECSASWQPRVRTVQGVHIAGLDLHRDSYISESVPLSVCLCHYQCVCATIGEPVPQSIVSIGGRESWSHGVMESWSHGVMESWSRGGMESWSHGVMESCSHGVMESCTVSRCCK